MVLHPAPSFALAVGFGCRRGCPGEHLAALLEGALLANNLQARPIAALASLDRKADEPGLLQLAGQLGCDVHVYSAQQLQGYTTRLSHRSARVYALTGCYGVAESAALALAEHLGGGNSAQLLVTRQTSDLASVAIAVLAS